MPPKVNPLKLNPLQLKTLTLLQELATLPGHGAPADESGSIIVSNLPHPHGDHFHMGKYVVAARDASGLANPAAWAVLERRGLIKSMFPLSCVLTQAGSDYDTGLRGQILRGTDH